jgi:hypothetical protein
MANWCNNYLWFDGKKEEEVIALFKEMEVKSEDGTKGVLPEFIEDGDYFFDISVDGHNIRFETRWSPNIPEVVKIADKFGLNFELHYEELGNGIFGKTIYTDGVLTKYDLDSEDIMGIEFDDEKDCLVYDGKEYESDSDIYEELFEKKFGIIYF